MTVFTEGADIEALREASQNLRRMTRSVIDVERNISGIVGSLVQEWGGADSSRASARYSNEVRPSLTAVPRMLNELADLLDQNTSEQTVASDGLSGSGDFGGGSFGGAGAGGSWGTEDDHGGTGISSHSAMWTTHSDRGVSATWDERGAQAEGRFSGTANIYEGSAHYKSGSAEVDATATVGVSGSASASASLDADGLSVNAGGEVFGGARAGAGR